MESDRQRASDLDQLFRALEVHVPIGVQEAEDYTIHLRLLGRADFALHCGELFSGIHKISSSRTNHGEDRNPQGSPSQLHGFHCGRQSTRTQIGTQFDAIGATALCRTRRIKRFHRYFQYEPLRHGKRKSFSPDLGLATVYPEWKRSGAAKADWGAASRSPCAGVTAL